MRRGERAIESKDGQKAILEHCRVCSLAFSGDEYPYVIPLNYGFVWNEDQETPVLYFHGAPVGTKIEPYAVVELEEPVYAPYVQRGNFPVLVEKITCKGIRPVPNKNM